MKNLLLTLSLVILSVISFSQIPVNGLVAYYPFTNGSLSNVAGNYSNIDTLVDTNIVKTTDMIGDTNDAYHFDGVSYLSVANSTQLDPLLFTSKSVTYCGWFKIDSLGISDENGIFSMSGPYSFTNQLYLNSNDKITFDLVRGQSISSTDSITPNVWYFYTVLNSVSPTEHVKLYLNNKLESAVTYSYNEYLPSGNLSIGYYNDNTDEPHYFNGSITQFMIYNRLLDSTEIANIYNTFDTLMPKPPVVDSTVVTDSIGRTYTITPSSLSTSRLSSPSNKTFKFYNESGILLKTGESYTTQQLVDTVKYFITTVDTVSKKVSTPISVTINVKDTTTTITTVVREYSELSTSVYPNPTTEFVNVSLQKESVVCLYTIEGKLVEEKYGKNLKFDLSNLLDGVYLINGVKVIKN